MALLVYADSGVTGQVLGKRGGYAVDGDQEFLGLGAANVGAALTGGFPVNGSQSRSFTAADVGARSQVMNVGVLVLVILTLLVLTPLFAPAARSRRSRASSSSSPSGCSTRPASATSPGSTGASSRSPCWRRRSSWPSA